VGRAKTEYWSERSDGLDDGGTTTQKKRLHHPVTRLAASGKEVKKCCLKNRMAMQCSIEAFATRSNEPCMKTMRSGRRREPRLATVGSEGVRSNPTEIIAAVRRASWQFRESNMHGNPWFRLLRHEVRIPGQERADKSSAQEEAPKELAEIKKETRNSGTV